ADQSRLPLVVSRAWPLAGQERETRNKKSPVMNPGFSFQRLFSVARKESLHIRRDPGTLFFALFIPVIELFMLGYAIDTNIRDVSTVILDECKTTESRQLIQRFENS